MGLDRFIKRGGFYKGETLYLRCCKKTQDQSPLSHHKGGFKIPAFLNIYN